MTAWRKSFQKTALLILACGVGIALSGAGDRQIFLKPWSAPKLISTVGEFAHIPFAVADPAGGVHIAWSANTLNLQKIDLSLDTIFYTYFMDGKFSPVTDIFSASPGSQTRLNRMRIDNQDRLQLLYLAYPGMVFATAEAANAGDPQRWQSSPIAEDAFVADFASGTDGSINLVYIVNHQGVFFIHSGDDGQTWTAPVTIEPFDSEVTGSSVRIECGPDGVLHTAWGYGTRQSNWSPEGIGYARSTDGGINWQKTLTIKEGDNLPGIGFDRQGIVHLVFDNPAGSMAGRGHAWSRDGGGTWGRVERIFPGYRGQTYYPVMGTDSAGNFYLITAANPPEGDIPRLHFSEWRSSEWSTPQIISGDIGGSEGPSLAVSLGNHLVVAWFSYTPDSFGIWFTDAIIAVPAVPPRPLSTLAPTPAPTQPITGLGEPANGSTSTPDPLLTSAVGKKPLVIDPARPALIGVFSSIAALGALGIYITLKKRGGLK